jgi:RNA polymerase sigma-70 factor (ECF subfamily)
LSDGILYLIATSSGIRNEDSLSIADETITALVERAVAGNEDSFAQLLSLVAPRAFRTAVAILRDPQEAEDAVQEASIVAFRSIEKLRDENAFTAWFLHLVVNKAIDLLRKRKREQDRMDALSTSPDLRGGKEQIDKETVMDITQAVEQLPINHRSVIHLYYGGGYSTPQISKMIGRPEGTVRRFLSEAYKMLRTSLGSSWWEERFKA